ncbi:AAA domain-containing protein [Stackebrandtia albiflava]|uniref:AAA domain-containing protein n=1 Tax=Stackebrandtia albiflava TaxID=406432 RepID=A0A562V3Z0_9ACTN|nr:AAA family ATPase [Stackebrandtia albiflava]TWJ12596.1 AAA domain-containing protein [Stackebrandtia albiflava]
MTGRLIIITGVQAAGKTTVGRALAGLLPRAVHVDGDAVHRFVVSGEIPYDVPPPPGATEQLYLRYRGSLAVARVYRDAGFDAVFTDNIFGATLPDVLEMAAGPVHLIVLDPDHATVVARETARDKTGYTDRITPELLMSALREETPRWGLWWDSTGETAQQTAAALSSRLAEAVVHP